MNQRLRGFSASGFTLIEVMMVVAIIAILAAIALPSFNSQLIKSRRVDAQRAILEDVQALQRYFTANGRFATSAGGTTCGGTRPPATAFYTFSCAVDAGTGVVTFTATANAGTSQAADGNLTLDSRGAKTPSDKWKL